MGLLLNDPMLMCCPQIATTTVSNLGALPSTETPAEAQGFFPDETSDAVLRETVQHAEAFMKTCMQVHTGTDTHAVHTHGTCTHTYCISIYMSITARIYIHIYTCIYAWA